MKTTETNYEKEAIQFAQKHGIALEIISEDYRPYFPEDKGCRSVFKCRLVRNGRQYTFEFGQSIANIGQEPTMYDILACLTKYDPESFEWFCSNYGYDTDSRKAEKTYHAVVKEWEAVERLFGDILDELQEIQ